MAQFKTQQLVSHIAPSMGDFLNDDKERVEYDSTKLHIQTDLAEAKEGRGAPFVEYKWGLSSNYADLIKAYPNFLNSGVEVCEITWNIDTNGKKASLMVMDIKPLKIQKA